MDIERLEHLEQVLTEAIEAVEEEKGEGADALALVRRAERMVTQMLDDEKPERWDVNHPKYGAVRS